MRRIDWMEEHYPERVNSSFVGGVYGCPADYNIPGADDAFCTCVCDCSQEGSMCAQCWREEVHDEQI